MLQKKEVHNNKSEQGIFVYKFLNIYDYPYYIDESMFWDKKDYKLASFKYETEDDYDVLKRDVENMKKIENGLSEGFEFAFLIKKENVTDTIYADLIQNLWTIKKDGKFIYYKDVEGKTKEIFQDYSSFFSDCW
jgi:hypothetical protein